MFLPGYLLDTNHINAWETQNPNFIERLRISPVENIIWVCPIALGEFEWGLRITGTTDATRRAQSRRFIEENFDFVRPIDITTRETYAHIMEKIWRAHPPAIGRDTQVHLSSLNVQVNDVWIAAVALEHGLTLLTEDRMATIRQCVPEVNVQNWLE